MPLDAVCMSALAEEVRVAVLGARIDKIQQPTRDQILLSLPRSQKLLLNAGANQPRMQLTALPRENPAQPPMFCMLLRKHLTGAKILAVEQPELERVVSLVLEGRDEMGVPSRKKLVLEAIGRRSNLLLLDEQGRIIECLRRVDADASEARSLLPGMFYHFPPAQEGKRSPLSLQEGELCALLSAGDPEKQADRFLLDTFFGLSPLICREIVFRACGNTEEHLFALDEDTRKRMDAVLGDVCSRIRRGDYQPTLLRRGGKPMDFSYLQIGQYEGAAETIAYPSFGALLDEYYEDRERVERMRRLGHDLIQAATSARDRVRRKLAVQEKEYQTTQDRERLRRAGDLITANLYQMKRGAASFETADFYQEDSPLITIRLDPLLTPQQNAARYYKNYTKAKTAEQMLREQMERGEKELSYLESILEELREAETEQDFRDIRAEMREAGYLRRQKEEKKQMRRISQPRRFRAPSGASISVGRNNRQNDELTCRTAGPADLWFHTQKIHGSHVILHTGGQSPQKEDMEAAAMLAAYYSHARESQNVPVDYTTVRYVKKPAGAKPGMVIYTTYQTAYVTPDPERVKALRSEKG